MKNVIRKGILNTLAAAGANVVHDTSMHVYNIVDTTVTGSPNIIPPIFDGECKGLVDIIVKASQAEVSQIALLVDDGGGVMGTLETVSAATRYKIVLDFGLQEYESGQMGQFNFAYTTPNILTGVAATDRYNLYSALVNKINRYESALVTASLVDILQYNTGAIANPLVGDTVTGGTSTATAIVLGYTIASGTIGGGNATGNLYVYNRTTVPFQAAEALTSTTGTFTSNVTASPFYIAGQGIVLIDTPGYYPARPNPRKGATQPFADGSVFLNAKWNITRTAVYSCGIGSRMIQDTPAFDLGNQNVVTGEAGFILNAAVNVAMNYTTYEITVHKTAVPSSLVGGQEGYPLMFTLYADESNGTYLTALTAALQAIA